MLKLGEAKKIVGNLLKVKDVKLAKGFTLKSAAEKIMPVATASLALHQLRDIPVFGQILTGLDRLYDFASGLIAKIPIIGWASDWVVENINKPLATFLGGYAPKEDGSDKVENDKEWYLEVKEDLQITDTTSRPVGISYTPEVTKTTITGAVARMMHLNVNIFQMHKMTAFTHTMSNLWENMTNGYRRSVTYTQNQVEVYINNSVSYYILAKYFEKKLGFIKYDDPSYPDFRDDWSLTYNQNGSVGVQQASLNPMLSMEANDLNGFIHTKEVYEVISKWNRNFLLPKNLKKWIDHYFGSVFILDNDTANIKYIDVNPITLYFAYYDHKTDTYSVQERALTSFTIDDLLNELTVFFKDYATVRADLNNGAVFATSYDSKTPLLNLMETGWIQSYESYVPKPINSDTFKQAIINAYTTDTDFDELFKNGFIRFDYLNDSRCGDEFTALLFAGATVPKDNPWLKDGHLSAANIAIVLNGGQTGIDIPKSWVESSPLVTDKTDDIIHLSTPHVAIFKTESGETDEVSVNAGANYTNIETTIVVPSNSTADDVLPSNTTVETDNTVFSTNSYSKYWFGTNLIYFKDENGRRLRVVSPTDPIDFTNAVNTDVSSIYVAVAVAQFEEYVVYARISCDKTEGGSWFNPNDISMELDGSLYKLSNSYGNLPPFIIGLPDVFEFKNTEYKSNMLANDTYFGSFDLDSWELLDGLDSIAGTLVGNELPYRDISSIYFELGSDGVSLVPIINLYCNTSWNFTQSGDFTVFSEESFTPLSPWTFAESRLTISYIGEGTPTAYMETNTLRSLVGYSAWCHNAMGYSIPVSDTSIIHVTATLDADTKLDASMSTTSLLKEDYVPLYINRNDLPWILYWMYQSLFYIELLPYKRNK